MKSCLFICKKRLDSYGVSYGLKNSAEFIANKLNDIGISSKVVNVIDNNCIEKEVVSFNPSHVFIEALWVVPSKIKLLSEKYKNIKWNIRIHSNIPFLANEGIAIEWLYEYSKLGNNVSISSNNKTCVGDFEKINLKCEYLPNIYYPKTVINKDKITKNDTYLDIGCFGSIRPMKNHLLQAISAIKFAENKNKILRFHINGNRIEQKGDSVYKNIVNLFKNNKHELIEHDWMNHEEFLKLVSTMDIGMQVSMTETFNIVSADFVYCEVPIVVCNDISWLSFFSKSNYTSSNSMICKLNFNLVFSDLFCCKFNKFLLNLFNKKSTKCWEKFLSNK